MPRLLSLNNYNYRRGGSDAVFLDHDKLFREAGWDTAVFTMHHPKNEPSPWSKYFADELEFGHSYSLQQKFVMASKVIYSWEARNKLGKLLEIFSPDIAHAHCIYHHLSPSVLSLLQEQGVPVVMTAHDLKLACPAYKMLNRNGICERCINGNLAHLVVNRCIHNSITTSSLVAVESAIHKSLGLYRKNLDKIVTPSLFFRNKLMQWGWPAKKLVYIPNFLDCNLYTPHYAPGDYFLYFGRLAEEKGVDTLIRAAAAAGVKLKIAGTGPFEKPLRATKKETGGEVEFLGYCSGDTLKELIRRSRAVVLPSEWYENAPISILEAYASGKPVIGARIGGIPEMVPEDQTGKLFESGDIHQLTDLLSYMQNLPEDRLREMGKSAREYVANTYSPDRYQSEMIDLYNALAVKPSAINATVN